MNKKRITFSQMFQYSLTRYSHIFTLFDASLFKVFFYFLLLNIMMFLPITLSVVQMEDVDYGRFGFTFHEEYPDWLPSGLPTGCVIESEILVCASDTVFEYDIMNRDTNYHIYFNVEDGVEITEPNTIIFYESGFHMNIRENNVLRLTYSGFGYTDFNRINQMEKEEAADILFEGMFQSIKPAIMLPIILVFAGILTLTNLILLLAISGISMMFSFNQSQFPSYPNMIKLFVFASTVPSLINLVLGFFGLSAFTSISYNIITPILAYFMYKSSRQYLELH